MDEHVSKVFCEFHRQVREWCPEARVDVMDWKWSTEDVNLGVVIPDMAEESEDRLREMVSGLEAEILERTGVYILALFRTASERPVG